MLALLRAVNVGGRKVRMDELRALAQRLGWTGVQTYIQSGNLLFDAPPEASESAVEARLEAAIRSEFDLEVPVILRTARSWAALAAANPFPDPAEAEPNRLLLLVSRRPILPGAERDLKARAGPDEHVAAAGGAIWIHYGSGIARSKLTPAAIDRACGSPTTGRNYRTVLQLKEMLCR